MAAGHARVPQPAPGIPALVAQVVDGDHARRARPALVAAALVEQERDQGSVPVVDVEDVREPVQPVAQLPGRAQGRLAEEDEARQVPVYGGVDAVILAEERPRA